MIGFILLIALIITLLIYIPQKYPTAFCFFRSPRGAFSYFGAALNVIKQRKWIIFLPICLQLASSLISIGHQINGFARSGSLEMFLGSKGNSLWVFTPDFIGSIFLEQVGIAVAIMKSGFYHVVYSNFVYLWVPIICLIFAKPIGRKVKSYLGVESYLWIELVERKYPLARGVGLLLLTWQIMRIFLFGMFPLLNLTNGVGNILTGLCALIPYSICIGLVFSSSKLILSQEECTHRNIWSSTLDKFAQLYVFNLIIWMIYGLMRLTAHANWGIYRYIILWIGAGAIWVGLVMLLPLTSSERTMWAALKNAGKFVMDNLVKIFTLMVIALLIMAVPTCLLESFLYLLNGTSVFWGLLFGMVNVLWQIGIAIVFILALFKLYLDWKLGAQIAPQGVDLTQG